MAEAVSSPRAAMEDVAIHKRDGGFGSYKLLIARDLSIVQAHDHVMRVDKASIRLLEQNSTIPHHSTFSVLARLLLCLIQAAAGVLWWELLVVVVTDDGVFDLRDQTVHGFLWIKPLVVSPFSHHCLEQRP